jgi:hypothetical protein
MLYPIQPGVGIIPGAAPIPFYPPGRAAVPTGYTSVSPSTPAAGAVVISAPPAPERPPVVSVVSVAPVASAAPAVSAQGGKEVNVTARAVTFGPPKCHSLPIPAIIYASLAVIGLVYIAAAPGISNERRGTVLIVSLIWSLLWFSLIWYLWSNCYRLAAWILLFRPRWSK